MTWVCAAHQLVDLLEAEVQLTASFPNGTVCVTEVSTAPKDSAAFVFLGVVEGTPFLGCPEEYFCFG